MSISQGATDIIGGGGGYGFGGFGGIAPIGIIGLNTLFGQNQWGRNGCDNNGFSGNGAIPGTTVLEQNVSELRKDVQGVNTEIHVLGNEIAASQAAQTNAIQADFRNLDNQICGVEKTLLQQSYAQSLQAFQNTQAIQNQVSAFQNANDLQFCSVKQQINADGDATRALINSINEQNLRDKISSLENQLGDERRNRSFREVEINVSNSNSSIQNQMQQQAQLQRQDFASFANLVSDQLSRQTNQLINVGSGVVAGNPQNNNNANTKIS